MAKPKRAMPSGKDLINYDFTYATRLTWCTLCPHPAKGVCRGYLSLIWNLILWTGPWPLVSEDEVTMSDEMKERPMRRVHLLDHSY